MDHKTRWILELIDKVSGPMKGISGTTDGVSDKVTKFGLNSQKVTDAIKSEMPVAARAIELLANPYVAATAGAVALGAATYKFASMANDWRTGLSKINVTAQMTKGGLDGLSDKLLNIGGDSVSDIEEVPEAFNKIISAGLDVNTSLKTLQPTLKAAKAGFTDIETTAAAGVGVMNSSGRDINTVYDVLFATLNKGNAEFKDIAQYLPKIMPLARGAGFALEETAGAWAYLTAQGQSSEQATTGIMNLMKALSTPDIALGKLNKTTGKLTEGLPAIGVKVLDANNKMRSLKDIALDLSNVLNGLSDKQKMLKLSQAGLTDMESKSAILSLVQDYGKFSETVDFVTHSQGQLNQAYENAKTPLDSYHKIWNKIKILMIKMGDYPLQLIGRIGDKILGVINYFKGLYNSSEILRDSLSAIGTAVEWAFKIAFIPISRLWNILKGIGSIFSGIGSAIGWVFEKTSGLIGGFENLYHKIRPYLIWIKELFGQIADIMYKVATFDFKGAVDSFKNFRLPSMAGIKNGIAWGEVADKKSAELERYQGKYDALAGRTDAQAEVLRKSIINAMEAVQKGSSKNLSIASVSPKIKATDLDIKPTGNASELTGSGHSSIKSINQKIEIKNYFTVSNSSSQADIDIISEKVVRAINDKLRDATAA